MDSSQRVRAMLSFVQAAERGSFAAAARSLGISPAAVGKNVAGLEAALGVRLMNRTTRSLQLTSEGQAFFERARVAIAALDLAIDAVAAQRAEPSGRVRISTSTAFGRGYLLPLLPPLQARHPLLSLELDFDDRRVDLVRDGYDIALRGGLIEDSSLITRPVCDLFTLLVASPDYLRVHGVPESPDDLARHRLISVRFLSGTTSRWHFKTAGGTVDEYLPAHPALTVSAPEAAADAALLGLGIAQVGAHHVWSHLRDGQLRVVLGRWHDPGKRRLVLQYPHRALVAPRVRVSVEFILDALSRNEALQVDPRALATYAA